MKHSSKILLIEVGIIIASLFCTLIFKINYKMYLITLIALSVGIYFILKNDHRKERFHNEVILIILIATMLYYAITFLMGFFWGVYYSTYSKSFLGILRNVFTGLIIILSIENVREALIKNSAYHKSIVWITPIVCTLLEIPSQVNFELYTSTVDLFNISLTLILPCFVKNIALTYITYKTNKISSIIYQLLYTMPNYFLPIFPNLGEFFYIIVNTLFPALVIILIANITTLKVPKIKNSRDLVKRDIASKVIMTCMIVFILLVLYLTSNMFRFAALTIGSPSMTKTINKGDIIIIDKKDQNIKLGDIIAFHEQGKIIVHRVISIDEDNKSQKFQTKGDANLTKDGWKVSETAVIGKVKFRIRWLGWPTIKLSEFLESTKKGK